MCWPVMYYVMNWFWCGRRWRSISWRMMYDMNGFRGGWRTIGSSRSRSRHMVMVNDMNRLSGVRSMMNHMRLFMVKYWTMIMENRMTDRLSYHRFRDMVWNSVWNGGDNHVWCRGSVTDKFFSIDADMSKVVKIERKGCVGIHRLSGGKRHWLNRHNRCNTTKKPGSGLFG